MTYENFIQSILDTRGRFGCGDDYHEKHHIVPKCIGGSNDQNNLIDLYAKEHFIAHKLLAEENPDNNSLVYAWACMAWAKNSNQERIEITPEEYEEAKRAFSKSVSEMAKDRLSIPENNPMYDTHRTGADNPMYGKHHTEETKRKLSELGKLRYANKEDHPWYGRHHSEESKQKMSEKRKLITGENHPRYGKRHTDETRRKMGENHKSMRGKNSPLSKTVEQYTKSGEIVNVFESTGEASRQTGVAVSSIGRCANGILKSAGGYVWKYVN